MSIRFEVTGNLTSEPQANFTHSGTMAANVTLISEDRYRNDAGEWDSANRTAVRVSAYGDLAEYLSTLPKGRRVRVIGRRVEARGWVNTETGEALAQLAVTADDVYDADRARYRTSAETETD